MLSLVVSCDPNGNWVDVSTGLKNLFCHAGMVGFAKPCVDRITNSAKMHRFLSNFIQIHSNLAQICKTKI